MTNHTSQSVVSPNARHVAAVPRTPGAGGTSTPVSRTPADVTPNVNAQDVPGGSRMQRIARFVSV